jgi:hypothetical protein
MKMEQTECSKTSAYKIQRPGYYPEENIQHSEYGESLKSSSHLVPSEYQLLDPLKKKKSCDTITPLTNHCRTPYVGGSREGRKTSTGW